MSNYNNGCCNQQWETALLTFMRQFWTDWTSPRRIPGGFPGAGLRWRIGTSVPTNWQLPGLLKKDIWLLELVVLERFVEGLPGKTAWWVPAPNRRGLLSSTPAPLTGEKPSQASNPFLNDLFSPHPSSYRHCS